jgi:hypothetical protein
MNEEATFCPDLAQPVHACASLGLAHSADLTTRYQAGLCCETSQPGPVTKN